MDSHSLQSGGDCKTNDNLPAAIDAPPKCNGMGDTDTKTASVVDAFSTETETPSGGGNVNNTSESVCNDIDDFLCENEASSNGRVGDEAVNSASENDGNAVQEAATVEDDVSQPNDCASVELTRGPDDDKSDSCGTPLQDEDDQSDTTHDVVRLLEVEESDNVDSGKGPVGETEHVPATKQADETDAEPIYESEAMRSFHLGVTEPVRDPVASPHGSPVAQMDVDMDASDDKEGDSRDAEEDMDVAEPAAEADTEAVARQQSESGEMEVEDAAQTDTVGKWNYSPSVG